METVYGYEQYALARTAFRRFAFKTFGSYDLGARVRYAAVERELARLAPPGRVLDAGSGKGQLSFALARRWPGAAVVGVDNDVAGIDHARAVAAIAAPAAHVTFVHATLPLAFEERFDLVVSVDVLEHVDDDVAFVSGLAAATAPDGRLILHVPAAGQRRYLAHFEEQHDHVRDGYAPRDLAALLERAGYRDIVLRPTFGALGAIGWEGFALSRAGNPLARLLLPLWYALSALDTRRIPRRGNGILATARR
jgi:SAM-dependent methyltransferase